MEDAKNSQKFGKEKEQILHTFVTKLMFSCKCGQPDVGMGDSTVATYVKDPNQDDWNKLIHIMNILKRPREDALILEAENTEALAWDVHTAFVVHQDMTNHAGAVLRPGKGELILNSARLTVKLRGSMQAEFNGIDAEIGKIIWVRKSSEAQVSL
jgi:hypothetical protein